MSEPTHPSAQEVVKTARAAEAKAKQTLGQAIQERSLLSDAPASKSVAIDEHIRDTFAIEAFKLILESHLGKGSAFTESDSVGTWCYRLADAAMRGRASAHNALKMSRGAAEPMQPIVPVPAAPADARPLEEILEVK